MHLPWRSFGLTLQTAPRASRLFRVSSDRTVHGLLFAATLAAATLLRAAPPPPSATGANVDESRVQQTLYVDPANAEAADDDRHGTSADAPFATLRHACQAAARLKDSNRGVRLIVAAGTYRESAVVDPPPLGKADTDAPLVIEAAERDQTVIDGADTEGWTPSTWQEADGRWTHPWPFTAIALRPTAAQVAELRRLPPAASSAAYRHGALLLINGTPLRQVNTPAELQPGTFLLQSGVPPVPPARRESAPAPGGPAILVQPPEDTPLADAIIQVGARPVGLAVARRRNVVVRGLLFQHTAAPGLPLVVGSGTTGLAFDGCANVLVEDVLSQWHDGGGLRITGAGGPGDTDFTLRRVRLLHNGGVGLSVEGVQNLLAEDGEASFNNFRGEWGGWIDPQRLAGVRAMGVKGSTWRRQRTVGNVGRGLWFNRDTNLTVEESVVRDNAVSGVLCDASPGPTLLRRNLVANTRAPAGGGAEAAGSAAVAIFACPDVMLESNVFLTNEVPALGLGDRPPGLAAPAPATGRGGGGSSLPLRSERHVLRHNVIYGQTAAQLLCAWPGADRLAAADLAAFYPTLTLEENSFWNPATPEVFVTYGRVGARPAALNFEAWMAFLAARVGGTKAPAQPLNSRWQDPLFLNPAEGNFRLREDSPLQDWDLLVDENLAGQ